MNLSIISFLVLSTLGSILTVVQSSSCRNGTPLPKDPLVCVCNENYAGPDRLNNCFLLDESMKIIQLQTIGSCTDKCNWTKGADVNTYDSCVNPTYKICGG